MTLFDLQFAPLNVGCVCCYLVRASVTWLMAKLFASLLIPHSIQRGETVFPSSGVGGGVGISTPFNNNTHLIVFSFFLVSHQTGWTALVCRLLEKLAKNR